MKTKVSIEAACKTLKLGDHLAALTAPVLALVGMIIVGTLPWSAIVPIIVLALLVSYGMIVLARKWAMEGNGGD